MTREFSAGGAVFTKNGSGINWLIIKPRASELFPGNRFQLPKGHLEKEETAEYAALREVLEETGITAKIISKAGTSKYPFKAGNEKIFKIVTFFLMEYVSGVLTQNPEVEELFWLPFEQAKKKLTYSDDKKILQQAFDLLKF